jgi:hypothetical protein
MYSLAKITVKDLELGQKIKILSRRDRKVRRERFNNWLKRKDILL